jgi:hypothetical protein
MGILWYSYGVSVRFLWDFYGISMMFLWYFFGVPMGFLWEFHVFSLIEGSLEVKLPTIWTVENQR